MATTTPTPLRPTEELSAKAARLEADLLNAPPPAAAEPITETDKLAMTGVDIYYGSHKAVRDVNLRVQANAITAFIGPSGCGKSTVLRCFNRMNDLIPGAQVDGKVTLDGQDIYAAGVQPVEVRRRVGLVFQRPEPVPDVHLRERRLRPAADGRIKDRGPSTRSSSARSAAPRSGTRSRTTTARSRPVAVRRPAAAAVHRPDAGDRPGGRS